MRTLPYDELQKEMSRKNLWLWISLSREYVDLNRKIEKDSLRPFLKTGTYGDRVLERTRKGGMQRFMPSHYATLI